MGEMTTAEAAAEVRQWGGFIRAFAHVAEVVNSAQAIEAAKAAAEVSLANLRQEAEQIAASNTAAKADGLAQLEAMALDVDAKKGAVAQARKQANEILASARNEAAQIKTDAARDGEALIAAAQAKVQAIADDEAAGRARIVEVNAEQGRAQAELGEVKDQIATLRNAARAMAGV